MKTLILHISDTHLTKEDNEWCRKATEKIVNAITLKSCKKSLLIITYTGDITQSGLEVEFDLVNNWIKDLKSKLSPHFSQVNFISIPGNHDCDLQEDDEIRGTIIDKITKEGISSITEKFVNLCISPLKNYFSFLADTETPMELMKPSAFGLSTLILMERELHSIVLILHGHLLKMRVKKDLVN